MSRISKFANLEIFWLALFFTFICAIAAWYLKNLSDKKSINVNTNGCDYNRLLQASADGSLRIAEKEWDGKAEAIVQISIVASPVDSTDRWRPFAESFTIRAAVAVRRPDGNLVDVNRIANLMPTIASLGAECANLYSLDSSSFVIDKSLPGFVEIKMRPIFLSSNVSANYLHHASLACGASGGICFLSALGVIGLLIAEKNKSVRDVV
jgi:hypothetical protein